MKKCPECGRENATDSWLCDCGHEFDGDERITKGASAPDGNISTTPSFGLTKSGKQTPATTVLLGLCLACVFLGGMLLPVYPGPPGSGYGAGLLFLISVALLIWFLFRVIKLLAHGFGVICLKSLRGRISPPFFEIACFLTSLICVAGLGNTLFQSQPLGNQSRRESRKWQNAAAVAMAGKDYDEAITDINEAIRIDPANASFYDLRENIQELKGDFGKAVHDLNEMILLDPKTTTNLRRRGYLLEATGKFDRAIADFSQLILLNPRDVVAWNDRGVAFNANGEHSKAISDFDEALKLDPKDAEAWSDRGVAYYDSAAYEKAIADFNEAIRLKPDYGDAIDLLARLFLTCPKVELRDAGKAYEFADKGLHLFNRARKCFDTFAMASASRGWYEQACKFDSMYLESPQLSSKEEAEVMGRINTYSIRWSGVAKAISEARKAFKAHDYDLTVASCDEAIRIDPQNSEAYHLRSSAHGNKHDYDKQIEDCNAILHLWSGDWVAYESLGYAYKHKGEYLKSMDSFKMAMGMQPTAITPYRMLALSLATCPDAKYRDGAKAVEYAELSCEMTGSSGNLMADREEGEWKMRG